MGQPNSGGEHNERAGEQAAMSRAWEKSAANPQNPTTGTGFSTGPSNEWLGRLSRVFRVSSGANRTWQASKFAFTDVGSYVSPKGVGDGGTLVGRGDRRRIRRRPGRGATDGKRARSQNGLDGPALHESVSGATIRLSGPRKPSKKQNLQEPRRDMGKTGLRGVLGSWPIRCP